jgi:sigma-B regulation protein RsbU (phosphoserine phosphatase)
VALSQAPSVGEEHSTIPLVVAGNTIGSIVLGEGQPRLSRPDSRQRLQKAIEYLARAASELCQHDLELKHRVRELSALTRMSSLLVRTTGPGRVLEVALESALEVLGLDAGAVMLLPEDADGVLADSEADLVLSASRNLSRDWLESPLPLSKERLFDRDALAGRIVVVEDISRDERILIRDRAVAEGLMAAIHVGLVFQNRPLGVMRLYSRSTRTFDEWDRRTVSSIAQQAAASVEQARLLRFEQEEQRIQRQLQLAADVQRRMLPRGVPSVPWLDLAARYIPSFELGGDFYDFIELNGHLGLTCGDVVGKGIAAALLMSAVRASLRAHVQGTYDIDEVVAKVNQALCRDTRDNEFASLWYGVIDPARLRLTYCSAGHEPPLVVHVPRHRAPNRADLDELGVGGMVVGIDPSQRYQRAVFDLKPRDVLVAYTDGLIDATSFTGQRWGKKRLCEALLRCFASTPEASASEILEHILWELRQFSGLTPRTDDRTLVVIRVKDHA